MIQRTTKSCWVLFGFLLPSSWTWKPETILSKLHHAEHRITFPRTNISMEKSSLIGTPSSKWWIFHFGVLPSNFLLLHGNGHWNSQSFLYTQPSGRRNMSSGCDCFFFRDTPSVWIWRFKVKIVLYIVFFSLKYCWWQPEIRRENQLRLVGYPIFAQGFGITSQVVAGFLAKDECFAKCFEHILPDNNP